MRKISITEMEAAINHFRVQFPASEDAHNLCRQARILADAYALMIMEKRDAVLWGELNSAQQELMDEFAAAGAAQSALQVGK